MDPSTAISLGLGIAGAATSLFGGMSQASVAKQQAQVSSEEVGVEQQENAVRQSAMEMSGRRNQLEIVRNAQRARAMAIQTGNTQAGPGAFQSSGVQGGMAETTNEGYFGLQGVNNNLSFGRQMFGYDTQINQYRQQMATLGGQAATDQGIASIGGATMKAGPMVGSLLGGFGGKSGTSSGGAGFGIYGAASGIGG